MTISRRKIDNMNIFYRLKEAIFPTKPKVTDFFKNPSPQEARKGKHDEDGVCIESCGNSFFCDNCGKISNCNWIQKYIEFDKSKPSILLIDDNPGMVSFLRDDIETILEKINVNIEDYNILEFSSKFAVYQFIATHQYFDGFNVQYAVIDITYGGTVLTGNGNLRLTGVDVFKEIYEENRDVKFVFYTGNVLNKYIKSNIELMQQFKKIYADDINNYVMFKTTMSMDERQEELRKRLFS